MGIVNAAPKIPPKLTWISEFVFVSKLPSKSSGRGSSTEMISAEIPSGNANRRQTEFINSMNQQLMNIRCTKL